MNAHRPGRCSHWTAMQRKSSLDAASRYRPRHRLRSAIRKRSIRLCAKLFAGRSTALDVFRTQHYDASAFFVAKFFALGSCKPQTPAHTDEPVFFGDEYG